MAIHEPSFTLGIEEEYLLVDRDSRDLARAARLPCWPNARRLPRRQVSPEFLRSQIEVGTQRLPHHARGARRSDPAAQPPSAPSPAEFGLAPIAASTHPFAHWPSQHHTDQERYNVLARDLQQRRRAGW